MNKSYKVTRNNFTSLKIKKKSCGTIESPKPNIFQFLPLIISYFLIYGLHPISFHR